MRLIMKPQQSGIDTPILNDWDKEGVSPNEIQAFITRVRKARTLAKLAPINPYDLQIYCEVLINGATLAQLIGTAHCNSGFDLVDSDNCRGIPASNELLRKYEAFSKQYLGLELIAQGNDPRGAAFKLVVDQTLGDSFGDRTHLCVPCVDAYTTV